jgi:probable rRNA maturation factor
MLESAITALLRREDARSDVEISMVLCNDRFIRGLNAEHRGIDTPTDVLSFAQEDNGDPRQSGCDVGVPARESPDSLPFREGLGVGAPVLGDIVLSLQTADRQAQAAGWPLQSEVTLLALHGVLHLLGYGDETVAGAIEMRDKTAAALKDCGVPMPDMRTHPYFIEYN